jgi:hypothetical protein
MSQRDQIRRNEEYDEDRPRYASYTLRNEPRRLTVEHVVELLRSIGWSSAANMVQSHAAQSAELHRTKRALNEKIVRLQARVNELDPPPREHGMRYTGD